jgi:P-type conjugative transfer protein TrbJ
MKTRRNLLGGIAAATLLPSLLPGRAYAFFGGLTGISTEWTQIANNIQLLTQASRQLNTMRSTAESAIQNARSAVNTFRSVELMIDNIQSLPDAILDQLLRDFRVVWNAAQVGREITVNAMAADDTIRDRYWTAEDYRSSNLDEAQFATRLERNYEVTADTIASAMQNSGLASVAVDQQLAAVRRLVAQSIEEREHTKLFQGMIAMGNATVEGLGNLQKLVAEQSRLVGAYYQQQLDQKAADDAIYDEFYDPNTVFTPGTAPARN